MWIFLNHVDEELFGWAWFANPSVGWPDFSTRLAQLRPLPVKGVWDVVANAARYVSWTGNYAVSPFLIASGFLLTWSYLCRSPRREIRFYEFLFRRVGRLLPTWWVAHILILLPPALIGWRVSVADWEFWLSLIGIRVTPSQIYYGVPAWWFIALILQLYCVFPWLLRTMERLGALRGFLLIAGISLVIRGLGLSYFTDYLDAWSRGAIFVSRVSEFAFGMWFAIQFQRDPKSLTCWCTSWRGAATAFLAIVVGHSLSLTYLGNTVSWLLPGLGIFVVLFGIFHSRLVQYGWFTRWCALALDWLGRHSLAFFLVHHPIVFVLMPTGQGATAFPGVLMRLALAIVLSLVGTVILEKATEFSTRCAHWAARRWSWPGVLVRMGFAALGLMLFVSVVELRLRRHAPQDVPDFGWGERPSLQPHEAFGFTLRPSSTTRLRWESYDYVVKANSHGFPGPEFNWHKAPGTFRIMVLGDAFTSAEGVDTEKAWPRLLEERLLTASPNQSPRSPRFEVINLAITGWGPNHYEAVITAFAERLSADMIVIGMFTNDLLDVQVSIERMREIVGFDRPDKDCWRGIVTGRHLFRWIRGHVLEAGYERVLRRPAPHTSFFWQKDVFDRSLTSMVSEGARLLAQRFETIVAISNRIGAEALVVGVPAPIQVAARGDLAYLPEWLVVDGDGFDYEQPQRIYKELCDQFGLRFLDLRSALLAAQDRRPYQRNNLHWTEVGHAVAREIVAGIDGL